MGLTGATGPAGPAGPLWQVAPPFLRGDYNQLTKDWWQWSASQSVVDHPLIDGSCERGQTAGVWFLGGAFGGELMPAGCDPEVDCTGERAQITRTCTIPAGTSLFFPLVNWQYNNIGEDPPASHLVMHDFVQGWASAAQGLSLSIDGVAVPGLDRHRVLTDPHEFKFVADGPANFTGSGITEDGFTDAVSDGYYVLLTPLAEGTHTLHFTGQLAFDAERHGFDWLFDLDVTYEIVVEAP